MEGGCREGEEEGEGSKPFWAQGMWTISTSPLSIQRLAAALRIALARLPPLSVLVLRARIRATARRDSALADGRRARRALAPVFELLVNVLRVFETSADALASLTEGVVDVLSSDGASSLALISLDAVRLLATELVGWLLGLPPAQPALVLTPSWRPSTLMELPPSGPLPDMSQTFNQPPPPPPPSRPASFSPPQSLRQPQPPLPCLLPPAPALALSDGFAWGAGEHIGVRSEQQDAHSVWWTGCAHAACRARGEGGGPGGPARADGMQSAAEACAPADCADVLLGCPALSAAGRAGGCAVSLLVVSDGHGVYGRALARYCADQLARCVVAAAQEGARDGSAEPAAEEVLRRAFLRLDAELLGADRWLHARRAREVAARREGAQPRVARWAVGAAEEGAAAARSGGGQGCSELDGGEDEEGGGMAAGALAARELLRLIALPPPPPPPRPTEPPSVAAVLGAGPAAQWARVAGGVGSRRRTGSPRRVPSAGDGGGCAGRVPFPTPLCGGQQGGHEGSIKQSSGAEAPASSSPSPAHDSAAAASPPHDSSPAARSAPSSAAASDCSDSTADHCASLSASDCDDSAGARADGRRFAAACATAAARAPACGLAGARTGRCAGNGGCARTNGCRANGGGEGNGIGSGVVRKNVSAELSAIRARWSASKQAGAGRLGTIWTSCALPAATDEEDGGAAITLTPARICAESGAALAAALVVQFSDGRRTLVAASAGDCRALLYSSMPAAQPGVGGRSTVAAARARVRSLLPVHRAEGALERRRIEAAGAWVSAEGRVRGLLRTSRALGDGAFKDAAGRRAEEQPVIALPDVASAALPRAHGSLLLRSAEAQLAAAKAAAAAGCESSSPLRAGAAGAEAEPAFALLVLASDGVTDVMSDKQVIEYARARAHAGRPLSRVAAGMARACARAHCASAGDNTTAVIAAWGKLSADAVEPDEPEPACDSEGER